MKSKGISAKQKEARIKNFSKGRIKGAFANTKSVINIAKLSNRCKDQLRQALLSLSLALIEWDS